MDASEVNELLKKYTLEQPTEFKEKYNHYRGTTSSKQNPSVTRKLGNGCYLIVL